jgi:hypothetical protein
VKLGIYLNRFNNEMLQTRRDEKMPPADEPSAAARHILD